MGAPNPGQRGEGGTEAGSQTAPTPWSGQPAWPLSSRAPRRAPFLARAIEARCNAGFGEGTKWAMFRKKQLGEEELAASEQGNPRGRGFPCCPLPSTACVTHALARSPPCPTWRGWGVTQLLGLLLERGTQQAKRGGRPWVFPVKEPSWSPSLSKSPSSPCVSPSASRVWNPSTFPPGTTAEGLSQRPPSLSFPQGQTAPSRAPSGA